jgi:hypothetical protein
LLSQVLVMLLFRRLGGICRDFEGLASRFQAGRLWRVAARVVVGGRVAADSRLGVVAALRWPGRFGWLVRAASYHAAGYGSQLRHILGQPEMVALLVAAPQAARILRPLCRMLAVETSLLRPRLEAAAEVVAVEPEGQAPPGPEGQAPPGGVPVVKMRVRLPRKAVDFGRIPLPKGVLAAARRQGFGKGG